MPALQAAIALADRNDIAEIVANHLDLDMTWTIEIALDVDIAIAEGGFGLRLGHRYAAGDFGFGPGHPHATTAAARHCLDHDRKTDSPGAAQCVGDIGDDAFGSGQQGDTGVVHHATRLGLVTHALDHIGARSDKGDADLLADIR